MWNEHLANNDLMHAVLSGDMDMAQVAIAAGASVMWSHARQRHSLLEVAIRLHSVTFVDFLVANGATIGARELDTLLDEVKDTKGQSPQASGLRRLRGVAAALHKHGAEFEHHIDALADAQPVWFQGIQAHCHQQRPAASVMTAPRVSRRRSP